MQMDDEREILDIFNDLENQHEFKVSSPMFIPWQIEKMNNYKDFLLNLDEKPKDEEHFFSHI
jgi:hypothetical protein